MKIKLTPKISKNYTEKFLTKKYCTNSNANYTIFWPQILTLIARERQKLKLFGVQVLQMRVHNLWRNPKCLIEYTPLKLHGRRFCIHLELHSLVLQKIKVILSLWNFQNLSNNYLFSKHQVVVSMWWPQHLLMYLL